MYFWKVDNLVEDLKTGKVDQKEEFKYMLFFTVLIVLTSDPYVNIGLKYNIYNALNTIMFFVISIIELYFCYRINSSGDNKDFIKRIICLGLPISIRVFVFSIPLFILGGITEGIIETSTSLKFGSETTIIFFIVMSFISVILCFYMCKKIKKVSVS